MFKMINLTKFVCLFLTLSIFLTCNLQALTITSINNEPKLEKPAETKKQTILEKIKANPKKAALIFAAAIAVVGLSYGGKLFWEKQKKKWKTIGGYEAYDTLLHQAEAFEEKEKEINSTEKTGWQKNDLINFLKRIKKYNPEQLKLIKSKEKEKLNNKFNKKTKYMFAIKEKAKSATPSEWLAAIDEVERTK